MPLVIEETSNVGAQMNGFNTTGLIVSVGVLLVLLLMSALVSGSEAAFFSLSPADKEEVKGDDSKKASFVNKMLNRPKELLATILIANNFINVGIAILSSSLFAALT